MLVLAADFEVSQMPVSGEFALRGMLDDMANDRSKH
jgi:hypothetical protein